MKGTLVLIGCILFSGSLFNTRVLAADPPPKTLDELFNPKPTIKPGCVSVENVTLEMLSCAEILVSKEQEPTAVISLIDRDVTLAKIVPDSNKNRDCVYFFNTKIKKTIQSFRFFSKKICDKPPESRFQLNNNLVEARSILPIFNEENQGIFTEKFTKSKCLNVEDTNFERIDTDKALISKNGKNQAILHFFGDSTQVNLSMLLRIQKPISKLVEGDIKEFRFFNKLLCANRDYIYELGKGQKISDKSKHGNHYFQMDGQTFMVHKIEVFSLEDRDL